MTFRSKMIPVAGLIVLGFLLVAASTVDGRQLEPLDLPPMTESGSTALPSMMQDLHERKGAHAGHLAQGGSFAVKEVPDDLKHAGQQYLQPKPLPLGIQSQTEPAEREKEMDDYDLSSLLSQAMSQNPTLLQAQAHISAETGKAIQAGLYPNPTIRYSAEQIGINGTAGEFQGGIFSQEIVRGRKRQLSRSKYLHRVNAAEALALAQQFRVCNDVKTHYYDVLVKQAQIQLQEELVKSYKDSSVTMREAFNLGQANAADLRQTDVALQRNRLQLLAMRNQLQETLRSLGSLVNTPLEQARILGELEGTPPELNFSLALESLLIHSPELLAARHKLEADKVTVQREMVEPIPNLNLEGGVGRNIEANQTVAVAGISFKLPIFDRNQGTIQQARADLQRQCSEIERLQSRLKQDLAMQFRQYETATQYIDQYEKFILPELKDSYRLMLNSYQARRADWKVVLQAQKDYFSARIDYLNWVVQWRKSQVMIDGMLLHGGLNAAPGPVPGGHIDSVAKPR